MMEPSILEQIVNKSSELNKKIIFPEAGRDPRVIHAALKLHQTSSAKPVLISSDGNVQQLIQGENIELPDSIEVINIDVEEEEKKRVEFFKERLAHKNLSAAQFLELAKDPLMTAGWMVANGQAAGAVAGSIASTADVIRSALRTIGVAEGTKLVSSTFLMELQNQRVLTYADCGVVPYPDSDQLADIAVTSGETHQKLTGQEPVIAFLSFSTKGSANHERVDLVRDATEIARNKKPEWQMDGELQFDAAYMEEVAKRKAPGSNVAGRANIYIFPNLDAGNISYKITERIGGAKAIGPILQGLANPYMDLSRGCSVDDIFHAACIASVLSKNT